MGGWLDIVILMKTKSSAFLFNLTSTDDFGFVKIEKESGEGALPPLNQPWQQVKKRGS